MSGQHITLPIYNLGCANETRMVEQVLTAVPGVQQVYVNAATEMAYVAYEPTLADSALLLAALEQNGYGQPASEPQAPSSPIVQVVSVLNARRLAVTGAIGSAVFYTLCLLVGLFLPSMVRWQWMLIAVNWTNAWTLVLGFVEVLLVGAFGAWMFAALYNWVTRRAVRNQGAR